MQIIKTVQTVTEIPDLDFVKALLLSRPNGFAHQTVKGMDGQAILDYIAKNRDLFGICNPGLIRLTCNGYNDIKEVKVGDKVYTPDRLYRAAKANIEAGQKLTQIFC